MFDNDNNANEHHPVKETLRDYEIKLIKSKFENLDSAEIIDKIVRSAKNQLQSKKSIFKPKDEYLESIKNNSKTNYTEKFRENTLKEVKTKFDNKIEENFHTTKMYIEKKDKEK
jgi:hypothetical protein